MVKTLYGKYLEPVCNIGVYLPVCVDNEVWVYTRDNFQAILFNTFHVKVKGKLRTKRSNKSHVMGLVQSRSV